MLFSKSIFGSGLAALVLVSGAQATEMPLRKAGLWEMKMVTTGLPIAVPAITMQQCTDETVDKDLSDSAAPMAKQSCSKSDIQKTATGYVGDAECNIGGAKTTLHTEATGDFNSAYTMKITSHTDGGGVAINTVMTIESKWLGACKPGQKPGDTMMPGGMKVNVKDSKPKAAK